MKRNVFGALMTFIVAATIAAPVVHAQKIAKADVPFAFRVDSTWLPAGAYDVRELGESATLIISEDNKQHALVLNSSAGDNKTAATKLVFHKIGDNYFLAEVWTTARDQGLAIHESKMEKEMTASNRANGGGGAESVIVALR